MRISDCMVARLCGCLTAWISNCLHVRLPGCLPAGLNTRDLAAIIKAIQPTALVGAASVGGAFNPDVLSSLAEATEAVARSGDGSTWGSSSSSRRLWQPEVPARPIVFALSNPTEKAECSYLQVRCG